MLLVYKLLFFDIFVIAIKQTKTQISTNMDKMDNTQPCTLEWVTLKLVYIASQISPEGMSPTACNRTLFGDGFYWILTLPI